MFSAITMILAIPLTFSLLTDLPLVFTTTKIRQLLNETVFIEKALLFVLLQSLIFLVFSKKLNSINILELITQNKEHNNSIRVIIVKNAFSVFIIIVSTYMCNRTGSIFDGNYGGHGFYSESSSFGGWPIIFCFSSAFLIITNNMNKYIVGFLIVILFYWLFHGNRSEVLIFATLPFITLIYGKNGRISIRNGIKFMFFFGLLLGVFQFIGLYREVSNIDNVVANSNKLSEGRSLSISTIGPSAYSITSAIGLIDTNRLEKDYGEKYIDLLIKILPSALNPFEANEDFSETLISLADAIGGANNIGEAYSSFGSLGIFFFSILLSFIFMVLSSKKSIDLKNKIFILALFIYMPRVVLYGNVYFIKFLSFYFILVLINLFLGRLKR